MILNRAAAVKRGADNANLFWSWPVVGTLEEEYLTNLQVEQSAGGLEVWEGFGGVDG